MKERPILMSAPMVRAILEDWKTQTRRVMAPQPSHDQYHVWRGKVTRDAEHRMWCWKDLVLDNIWDFPEGDDRKTLAAHCPYGVPGDRLWVRETWGHEFNAEFHREHGMSAPDRLAGDEIFYRATQEFPIRIDEWICEASHVRWIPSIHMPRTASRITLEVTDVRVQRLQEISDEDAEAEGAGWCDLCHNSNTNFLGNDTCPRNCGGLSYREEFEKLWDSINAKTHPWSRNPFVWAISFKRAQS